MKFGSLELFEQTGSSLIGIPTNHGLPIGQGPNNPILWTSPPTNGQILIGSNGTDPIINQITAGPGISISNGPGTITISSSNSGLNWKNISSNQILEVNNGYFCSGGGFLILNLPTSSSIGSVITIILDGSLGWVLNTGSSSVRIGKSLVNASNTLSSTSQGDVIQLVCQNSNKWNVVYSMGNIKIN